MAKQSATSKVVKITPAGHEHQVVTVVGGKGSYRRKPCFDCPWRKDAKIGKFPAESFRVSANTAEDMSTHQFSCHNSGTEKPATCAGFLLRGADHNLSVRLGLMKGRIDLGAVSDGGVPLYESYRAMAEANGVSPDDPALAQCRGPYGSDF